MFLCTKKISTIPVPILTFMLKDFLSSTYLLKYGEKNKADIEVNHLFSLCQWKDILSMSLHGNLETNWQHDAETLFFTLITGDRCCAVDRFRVDNKGRHQIHSPGAPQSNSATRHPLKQPETSARLKRIK